MRASGLRFGAIALLLPSLLPAPVLAAAEELEQAIQARNPELRALAARVDEARALIQPAGAWADPKLGAEIMDVPTLGGPRLSLMQMVPLRGQPALMGRMAELEAAMRQAQLQDRTRMLLAEGRSALADLAYVARTRQLLRHTRDLAARMSRIAEAKYGVGQTMQPDVLRAHVASTRLLEPQLQLTSRAAIARATLEAIAPGYLPATPSLATSPGLPPSGILDLAEQHSPMLRMRRLALEHAELGVELAERERLPDVEVGMAIGRQMPGDMPYVSGMVSVPLPVWGGRKQEPRVTSARARLAAEREALEAARRELRTRLTAALAQLQAATDQLALYRGGLSIQARQAFQAALASYQVNQTDFLMVLDSQMALYDVEMAEAMALTERLKMRAMIEGLVGRDLPEGAP